MESSQQFQPQQPEAESPDLTSGIAPTNIDESSDETSEKNPTVNNRLENPDNIQTKYVTAKDETINKEPADTNFEAEILLLLMKRIKVDSYLCSISTYFSDSLINFLDSSSYFSRAKEENLSDNDQSFFFLMQSFICLIYDLARQKLCGKFSEANYGYVIEKFKEHVQEGFNLALSGIETNKVICSYEDNENATFVLIEQLNNLYDNSDEDGYIL